ncbi:AraC family transcriptional regulator [Anaerocolumna sp. AGMB13020]|uniref:AraC family transcriptional regulator n=1 Tax=Anaerocolumna sp. AGMB13020 TaxID=3081750 RepID=UPI0029554B73|nr:AraC family transcriptional regulator [Anaerocolumna sp. AGMB13020]WOO34860.1 AraC family transcriptional regulator [Anaerocolumna sp. AGMB13020]
MLREKSGDISHISLYDRENRNSWFLVKRYYAMNFDFFDMEPHSHGEFEIMYIASGCCTIYSWTADGTEKVWRMKEGEYVMIDGGTWHKLEVVKGVRCRILNLEIALLPRPGGNGGKTIEQLREQSKSLRDFLALPTSIYKCYDGEGTLHTIITETHKQLQNPMEAGEHRVMQNLCLAQLLVELSRQRSKKYRSDGGSKYVSRTLSFLNSNYEKDIKVEDIAAKIGVSAAYLQRLFKEQTGKTLVDKINELRIEKAKVLLETSSLPVTDIAISVGFHNRQHFTYTFRKLTGCSPSVYSKHKGDYQVWAFK